jgi:hypothetical protein
LKKVKYISFIDYYLKNSNNQKVFDMKKYLIAQLLIFYPISLIYCQQQTAKFEDGRVINYEILNNRIDDIKKLNISYLNGINVGYYSHRKFQASIKYQPAISDLWGVKYGFDGIIFLKTFEIEKAKKLAVAAEPAGYYHEHQIIKKYIIRPTFLISKELGLHLGAYYNEYIAGLRNLPSDYYIQANELFVGIGYVRSLHIEAKFDYGHEYQKRSATKQAFYYADVVFYANKEIIPADTNDIIEEDNVSQNMGFRIYCEWKNSFGKNNIGIMYRLGFQTGPYLQRGWPILGIGLCFSL